MTPGQQVFYAESAPDGTVRRSRGHLDHPRHYEAPGVEVSRSGGGVRRPVQEQHGLDMAQFGQECAG